MQAFAAVVALVVVVAAAWAARPRRPLAARGASGAFLPRWRKLWYDHVAWTRQYIVSRLAGLPDKDAALGRLLANQQDLGRMVGSVRGAEAGAKMAALLTEHIEIGGAVIEAAAAGDQGALGRAQAEWSRNAADIARFLAGATALAEDAVLHHMEAHLHLTTREVVHRLGAEWDEDVANFDAVVLQALDMADFFAGGLA